MKILYIANSRLPTEKAHGLQIMKTIEALIQSGAEVTLLMPNRRNEVKADLQSFYGLKAIPRIVRVPNFYAWLEKPFHHLYFSLQRISFGKAAFFYALFSKADAIYSREITVSFFLSMFGKKVFFEDHEPKKSMPGLYSFFIKHIHRKIIVAQGLVEVYKRAGVSENSYRVIPNGVDLDDFKKIAPDKSIWNRELQIPLTEKVILYVGHLYAWKGVYTLLDASVMLKEGKVVLIGGLPGDQEKVRSYVDEKRMNRVVLKSFVPHGEVIRFIKSADVLILPNTKEEERSSKYTTPLKLFEYMASGVPIVSSDVESFKWYLKDGGNTLLFKADSAKDLVERISSLLDDTTYGRRLASKALTDVHGHTWLSRATAITTFISSC